LRFDDFSRATRSHTLARATAQTETILATARGLLTAARPMIERQGLTLVGVAVGNLDDDGVVQLVLPFDGHGDGALDAALDDARGDQSDEQVHERQALGIAAGGDPREHVSVIGRFGRRLYPLGEPGVPGGHQVAGGPGLVDSAYRGGAGGLAGLVPRVARDA